MQYQDHNLEWTYLLCHTEGIFCKLPDVAVIQCTGEDIQAPKLVDKKLLGDKNSEEQNEERDNGMCL